MSDFSPIPVCVAFKASCDSDLIGRIADGIQPDRRLKDPVKIQQSLEERRQELADKLVLCRFVGKVDEIRAALPVQGLAAHFVRSPEQCPAYQFLKWLSETLGTTWERWSAAAPTCSFLGFGVSEFLQLACAEAAVWAERRQLPSPQIPFEMWQFTLPWTPRFVLDPLKLLPSALSQVLPEQKRWEWFIRLCADGLVPEDAPPPGVDLERDLGLVLGLAARYQMIRIHMPVFA